MARPTISLLAGSVMLCVAITASAQKAGPARPYRGVYAAGTDQSEQVLSASGSVASGYDTSALLSAGEAGLVPSNGVPTSDSSIYNQYSGGLSYTASLNRL